MSSEIQTIKDLVLHKSMCVLPWHGFTLFPNGDVKNCAVSNELLGNIHHADIENILHNTVSQTVRKDMAADIRHERCTTCYRTEDLQTSNPLTKISNRIWYMKVMKKHDLSVYNQNKFAAANVLDLRWHNTCNYSCVYCGPNLSSKWAAERNKSSLFTIDEQALERTKKYIFDNIHTVKHVYLAGGEPLLIKENLELLQELKRVNPDATVRINTNLSVIDNKIFDLLVNDFQDTKWTISVDSIGDTYEYIRYPGNWNNFLNNLAYLYSKTKNIDYNMTWSVLNAYSIFDAVDFLQARFQCSDSVFVIQPIFQPKSLHICNLPEATLEELRSIITDRLTKCNSALYRNSLESMLSYTKLPVKKRLNKTMKFLDTVNQQRSIVMPESMSYLNQQGTT